MATLKRSPLFPVDPVISIAESQQIKTPDEETPLVPVDPVLPTTKANSQQKQKQNVDVPALVSPLAESCFMETLGGESLTPLGPQIPKGGSSHCPPEKVRQPQITTSAQDEQNIRTTPDYSKPRYCQKCGKNARYYNYVYPCCPNDYRCKRCFYYNI